MGGHLRECGCFDGPLSEEAPDALVSIRCTEHTDDPVPEGHLPMRVSPDGTRVEVEVEPQRQGPLMTIPKTRKRRRRGR